MKQLKLVAAGTWLKRVTAISIKTNLQIDRHPPSHHTHKLCLQKMKLFRYLSMTKPYNLLFNSYCVYRLHLKYRTQW